MESDDVLTRVAELTFRSLARSLALDGTIDVAGKSVEEVKLQVAEWIRDKASDLELQPIITHEQELLAEARSQREKGRHKFALMFYATWNEHTLNGALHEFAATQELERQEYIALVRLSLREKMGVVWRLLTGTDFPPDLRASILKIAEERNSFVHYKWGPAPESPSDGQLSEREDLLDSAEVVVEDLSALLDSIAFGENSGVANWARGR